MPVLPPWQTGELEPKKYARETGIKKFRDKRCLFLNEIPESIQGKIIRFFEKNRIITISVRRNGGDNDGGGNGAVASVVIVMAMVLVM